MTEKAQTGIIIQARMGSSRLPGKMGKTFFDGKTLLDVILERLLPFSDFVHLIVATSINPADDFIELSAERKGILVFRGSEEDVLARFIDAADQSDIKNIIRICADNPFIQLKYIKQLIKFNNDLAADYVGFRLNGSIPAIKTHLGFFPEWVTLDALKKINQQDLKSIYREHVTNYFYSDENTSFTVKWIDVKYPEDLIKSIRLTIDVEQDFEIADQVYKYLNENNISNSNKEILKYLTNRPVLIKKMKENIAQNEK